MNIDDPELDPRLAALYDAETGWRADDEFCLELAGRQPSSLVLDLGCGTGRLTTALAQAGHRVVGVDPNSAFLDIARRKSGADEVVWIRGTSADIPEVEFDLALMTSHVAQELITDDEFVAVLTDLRRALRPGGTLCFDTRDPAARAWEKWATTHAGTTRVDLPDGTVVDSAIDMTYRDELALFDAMFVFSDGSMPVDPSRPDLVPGTTWSRASYAYRFRTPEVVQRLVEEAGFTIEHLFGGWHGEPVGEGDGEIVVLATT